MANATRETPGRAARRRRRLRHLGLWGAGTWEYEDGQAEAVKRFTWDADVIATATGAPISLHYFTEAHLPIGSTEDLRLVERSERQALELLERAVSKVDEGVGYISAARRADFVQQAVEHVVTNWLTNGYPENWQERLRTAIEEGLRGHEAAAAHARALGAQPELDA